MDNENKKNIKIVFTQAQLVMRMIVGGYLDYLAYDLFKERASSTMKPVVMWSFIVLFTIIGTYFLAKALYLYIIGAYKGGKLDPGEDEEEEADADAEEVLTIEETEDALATDETEGVSTTEEVVEISEETDIQ